MTGRNLQPDHRPDFPFGCGYQWGPRLRGLPDQFRHVCNREHGHDGDHKCKCSIEAGRIAVILQRHLYPGTGAP